MFTCQNVQALLPSIKSTAALRAVDCVKCTSSHDANLSVCRRACCGPKNHHLIAGIYLIGRFSLIPRETFIRHIILYVVFHHQFYLSKFQITFLSCFSLHFSPKNLIPISQKMVSLIFNYELFLFEFFFIQKKSKFTTTKKTNHLFNLARKG